MLIVCAFDVAELVNAKPRRFQRRLCGGFCRCVIAGYKKMAVDIFINHQIVIVGFRRAVIHRYDRNMVPARFARPLANRRCYSGYDIGKRCLNGSYYPNSSLTALSYSSCMACTAFGSAFFIVARIHGLAGCAWYGRL